MGHVSHAVEARTRVGRARTTPFRGHARRRRAVLTWRYGRRAGLRVPHGRVAEPWDGSKASPVHAGATARPQPTLDQELAGERPSGRATFPGVARATDRFRGSIRGARSSGLARQARGCAPTAGVPADRASARRPRAFPPTAGFPADRAWSTMRPRHKNPPSTHEPAALTHRQAGDRWVPVIARRSSTAGLRTDRGLSHRPRVAHHAPPAQEPAPGTRTRRRRK